MLFLNKITLISFLSILFFNNSFAEDTITIEPDLSEIQELIGMQLYYDSINSTLNYEYGKVILKGGVATVNIPEGYKYLNGKDSDFILTDIWGNPPSNINDRSLGMLFTENGSPFEDSTYAINITYTEEGFIDDKDAKNIDFDELLLSMQEDCEAANSYRIEQGYEAIHLLQWASTPFYDAENKKLHWAKELQFETINENTLNYNIRILGRKGYLQLNAIGGMDVLEDVKTKQRFNFK